MRCVPATTPARARIVLAVLAFLAAAIALYLRLTVFDLGSANNDEGVYLRQAQALADGHLVVPFQGSPEAHQPWLFAIGDDGYISKYLPVTAASYALGIVVFGSETPVLAAMAAAVPVLTYLVARATALPVRRALVAAGLVGLSPAVLVEGGLLLSYLPLLVLVLACWLSTFRVVDAGRTAGRWWAVAAAALGALAVCARPLDGLLLVGPLLLWVLWRSGERPGTAAALFAGGLPIVGATLLYNAHVTGNPLKLPFSLLEPMDKFGFGPRRFFPEDKAHDFGLPEALQGTAEHFVVEPAQWMFGFLGVLVLAVWALRRGTAGERHRILVGSAALLLVAYFFFWGPWHASVEWGGTRTLGPFYAIALFPPLVFAALTVPLRARALAGLLVLASLHPVVNGLHALDRAQRDDRFTAEVLALVDPSVTTLLETDQPYTGFPVSAMGGASLALAARTPPSALTAGPSRILTFAGNPYRRGSARPRYELREALITRGSQVRLDVRHVGYGPAELIVVSYRGTTHACYQGFDLTLTLTAAGVAGCSGAEKDIPAKFYAYPRRSCPDATCLGIAAMKPPSSNTKWVTGPWRRLPLEWAGDELALITDGAVLRSQGYGWLSVVARLP